MTESLFSDTFEFCSEQSLLYCGWQLVRKMEGSSRTTWRGIYSLLRQAGLRVFYFGENRMDRACSEIQNRLFSMEQKFMQFTSNEHYNHSDEALKQLSIWRPYYSCEATR